MKTLTLKEFIEKSHLPAPLIRATIKQLGNYKYFTELAKNICCCCASGGFSGFIYYSDTLPFALKNIDYIMVSLESLADDMGEDVFKVVAGFFPGVSSYEISKAIGGKETENSVDILNALAWYALKEVACSYSDIVEG